MKVAAYFNDVHLANFDKNELDIIISALLRHCTIYLKKKQRTLSYLSKADSQETLLSKYFLHYTTNFYIALSTTFNDPYGRTCSKQKFHQNLLKYDEIFCGAHGKMWKDDLQKHLKNEKIQLTLKLEDFDDESEFKYEVDFHPLFIDYALMQLPYINIENASETYAKNAIRVSEKRLKKINELNQFGGPTQKKLLKIKKKIEQIMFE